MTKQFQSVNICISFVLTILLWSYNFVSPEWVWHFSLSLKGMLIVLAPCRATQAKAFMHIAVPNMLEIPIFIVWNVLPFMSWVSHKLNENLECEKYHLWEFSSHILYIVYFLKLIFQYLFLSQKALLVSSLLLILNLHASCYQWFPQRITVKLNLNLRREVRYIHWLLKNLPKLRAS